MNGQAAICEATAPWRSRRRGCLTGYVSAQNVPLRFDPAIAVWSNYVADDLQYSVRGPVGP